MTLSPQLQTNLDSLIQELRTATSQRRLEIQPRFGKVISELERSGSAIPTRIRNLHEQLLDETLEARFDNVPI